jgi:hypothetical protein
VLAATRASALEVDPLAKDDGFTPVTVSLPFAAAKSVKLYRMDGERVKIESLDLPAAVVRPTFAVTDKTGADARGLPPGATLLYVFEGVTKE